MKCHEIIHTYRKIVSVQELCVEYGEQVYRYIIIFDLCACVNVRCTVYVCALLDTHYTHFNSDMEYLRMLVNVNAFYSYVIKNKIKHR